MKTCLYSQNKLDIRRLLRSELKDEMIARQIKAAVSTKEEDGFVAEKSHAHFSSTNSMASIGG